ncbi:HK97 family phage prohead protease [Jiella sp. MQZ13P-4]|uniref:HK97 family phage prohead protease n=2 Tax=Jiella sonneratiae TaxID=2816856 RepID=A0ABS3J5G6_9HYPH|nr:HK97 family phage prohead protease [Jiella sonneratiae]
MRGVAAPLQPAGATPLPLPARFSGYAAIFGATDLAGDRIEPGAFAASLAARRPEAVRMLWQHDPARPIGRWIDIAEDRTGLKVLGEFALDTAGGREAAALAAAGAVDGLSIGFRTKLARRGDGGTRRRLVTIDLWEVSLVTFPMQERARFSLFA